MRASQGTIFIWTQTYREIFKSALVYFKLFQILVYFLFKNCNLPHPPEKDHPCFPASPFN